MLPRNNLHPGPVYRAIYFEESTVVGKGPEETGVVWLAPPNVNLLGLFLMAFLFLRLGIGKTTKAQVSSVC